MPRYPLGSSLCLFALSLLFSESLCYLCFSLSLYFSAISVVLYVFSCLCFSLCFSLISVVLCVSLPSLLFSMSLCFLYCSLCLFALSVVLSVSFVPNVSLLFLSHSCSLSIFWAPCYKTVFVRNLRIFVIR